MAFVGFLSLFFSLSLLAWLFVVVGQGLHRGSVPFENEFTQDVVDVSFPKIPPPSTRHFKKLGVIVGRRQNFVFVFVFGDNVDKGLDFHVVSDVVDGVEPLRHSKRKERQVLIQRRDNRPDTQPKEYILGFSLAP